jgi:hypothetical protein
VGALAAEAINGSLYWDDNLGQLFIRYANTGGAGGPVWVAAAPPSGGSSGVTSVAVTAPITNTGTATAPNIGVLDASDTQKGVIETATLAEAATGTSATLALTASTGVPKDTADMAGAAIIPSGTAASTTTAGAGKLRFYTNKRGWYGNDGTDWIPFDQRKPVVTAASITVKENDYVVVTAATQTITLPASPLPGACVTVVVAGTWLDTVVGRNGENIMGLAQDITLDKQYAAMQFTYTDSTNGWRLN